MKLFAKVWICALCLVVVNITYSSAIQITTDGGYENITVAISSSTTIEKTNLIKQLQDLLRATSKRLYTASGNRFYFKSAIISVPNEWTDVVNEAQQVYEEAQVKVVGKNSMTNSELPHLISTERQNECGKPGDYIQIMETFFYEGINSIKKQEYQFLQNWAALRYGVFEENGMSDSKVFPLLYPSESGWKVTTCDHPEYWVLSSDNECAKSKHEPDICQIVANLDNGNTLNSSVMSTNWELHEKNPNNVIPEKKFFCSSDDNARHNTEAPTPQNTFCKRKSTWKVITESDDFQQVQSPTTVLPELKIDIVRRTAIPTAIIVDPKLCGSRFNADSVAPRSVAKFLFENKQLTEVMINNKVVEGVIYTDFISKCRIFPEESQVLLQALKKAENNGMSKIIYIADGNTNYDSDFIQFLNTNRKFHVHVINYPERQRPLSPELLDYNFSLHNINKKTAITRAANCDVEARVQFDMVFNSIIKYVQDSEEKILVSTPIIGTSESPGTTGTLLLPFPGNIYATLYVCEGNQFKTFEVNGESVAFDETRLAAQTVTPIKIQQTEMKYSFTSSVNRDNYAIALWIVKDPEYFKYESTIIEEYISTSKNNSLPPKLKVVTNIDIPLVLASIVDLENRNSIKQVTLRKLPKEESNSVFMNTYIHNFIELSAKEATYRVVFTATDNHDRSLATYNIQSIATFSSQLTSSDVQYFPSRRILDLRVNETNTDTKTAILLWTAPGARFDDGIASNYYLHCGQTQEEIGIEEFVPLDFSPREPGTEENLTVPAHPAYDVHYCMLRVEANGMIGETSNVASFYMHTEAEVSSIAATIGIAVGVTLLVLLILAGGIFVWYRRNKNRQPQRENSVSYNPKTQQRPYRDLEPQIVVSDPLLSTRPLRPSPAEKQKAQEEKLQQNNYSRDSDVPAYSSPLDYVKTENKPPTQMDESPKEDSEDTPDGNEDPQNVKVVRCDSRSSPKPSETDVCDGKESSNDCTKMKGSSESFQY